MPIGNDVDRDTTHDDRDEDIALSRREVRGNRSLDDSHELPDLRLRMRIDRVQIGDPIPRLVLDRDRSPPPRLTRSAADTSKIANL